MGDFGLNVRRKTARNKSSLEGDNSEGMPKGGTDIGANFGIIIAGAGLRPKLNISVVFQEFNTSESFHSTKSARNRQRIYVVCFSQIIPLILFKQNI